MGTSLTGKNLLPEVTSLECYYFYYARAYLRNVTYANAIFKWAFFFQNDIFVHEKINKFTCEQKKDSDHPGLSNQIKRSQ